MIDSKHIQQLVTYAKRRYGKHYQLTVLLHPSVRDEFIEAREVDKRIRFRPGYNTGCVMEHEDLRFVHGKTEIPIVADEFVRSDRMHMVCGKHVVHMCLESFRIIK